jgi:hypothetical protein
MAKKTAKKEADQEKISKKAQELLEDIQEGRNRIKSLDEENQRMNKELMSILQPIYARRLSEGLDQGFVIGSEFAKARFVIREQKGVFSLNEIDALKSKYPESVIDEVIEEDFSIYKLDAEVMRDEKVREAVEKALKRIEKKFEVKLLPEERAYRVKKGTLAAIVKMRSIKKIQELIKTLKISTFVTFS